MSAPDVLHPAQFAKSKPLPRPSPMSTVCPKCHTTRDGHHICAGKPVGQK